MNNAINQFEGQEAQYSAQPRCQLINAKNDTLANIAKYQVPWGWYIDHENAKAAGFKPDSNWSEVEIDFPDSDNPGQTKATPGYISRHLRFVVLYRSKQEIEKKYSFGTKVSWKYDGLYFSDSAKYKTLLEDRENYRQRYRYLLLFLDSNNKPLSQTPIKIALKSAASVAFDMHMQGYYKNCEKAYYSSIEQPAKTINDAGRARLICDFELGLHRNGTKSPITYVQGTQVPTIAVGKTNEQDGYEGRKLKYYGASLDNLLIDRAAPLAKMIENYRKEYETFVAPQRGPETTEPTQSPVQSAVEEDEFVPF